MTGSYRPLDKRLRTMLSARRIVGDRLFIGVRLCPRSSSLLSAGPLDLVAEIELLTRQGGRSSPARSVRGDCGAVERSVNPATAPLSGFFRHLRLRSDEGRSRSLVREGPQSTSSMCGEIVEAG